MGWCGRTDLFKRALCLGIALCVLALVACRRDSEYRRVVVYVSVDQTYAEPVLRAYAERSGVRVDAIYDVEAAKTTGLVNRLIAERERPQADVFWSGEFAQTVLLQHAEVLQPYASPEAESIPDGMKDPDAYWAGFLGRARVLLINTDRLPVTQAPASIFDLLDERWVGKEIGLAYPLFGTTATHAAALYAALGPEEARGYFSALQGKGVRVLDGNAAVRDLVASGDLTLGLTDTDDACVAIKSGAPVEAVFLDQDVGGLGTLVIPNTVAMVAGAPHEEEARALIDYLLSPETGAVLVSAGWSHVPLRSLGVEPECFAGQDVRAMDVDLAMVYEWSERAKTDLAQVFIR